MLNRSALRPLPLFASAKVHLAVCEPCVTLVHSRPNWPASVLSVVESSNFQSHFCPNPFAGVPVELHFVVSVVAGTFVEAVLVLPFTGPVKPDVVVVIPLVPLPVVSPVSVMVELVGVLQIGALPLPWLVNTWPLVPKDVPRLILPSI